MDIDLETLESRLGRVYLRQRLGLELDHPANFEVQVPWINQLIRRMQPHVRADKIIRTALLCTGLLERAKHNSRDIYVEQNQFHISRLPEVFDGFTIMHLSDINADLDEGYLYKLTELVERLSYDIVVITGDYRSHNRISVETTVAKMQLLCAHLRKPIYGVLGNHDSVRMISGLEKIGMQMLVNESTTIIQEGHRIYLAGIDDSHFYKTQNLEKTAEFIPYDGVSILLSHSPDIYKHAAHADFDILLCGHTHGGQICLPGGIPVFLNSRSPRKFAKGAWRYKRLHGYTSRGTGSSILPARLNCPPELTLHQLLKI